jgi:hypothetical protein
MDSMDDASSDANCRVFIDRDGNFVKVGAAAGAAAAGPPMRWCLAPG